MLATKLTPLGNVQVYIVKTFILNGAWALLRAGIQWLIYHGIFAQTFMTKTGVHTNLERDNGEPAH